ncbi:UvrD/REP helicase [Beutenbergia cavernae DSM 12333]|uniref:DNA 3'-5' helicase n=1 Tax=Beutenbergia cavernae (strain ATCC BAA-8 / DSM 12333 / CCUG 43141 / JCM 11478 / NBRC 16432 / NCIMB 13614 / HKI 0122) TaxID=471853 RepID=C5BZ31_BEUC1|nr:ATP-dependent DNA helicase [Beutenbergia cavernae]ACQ81146.1 UvrD/REP helicase [Beutenbergia cavernae DSM 12333]
MSAPAREAAPESLLGALELARLLGRPAPTPEQVAVIEAPLEPMLVVAGAGSGKTATMTDRVTYLVANSLVRPSEVLGLTFTRKAASELAERVERHLALLHRHGLGSGAEPADAELSGASSSAGLLGEDRPRISTYNAYAGSLVKDYGLRIGVEPDAGLIGDAGRYQLAARVVESWDTDLDVDVKPVTVIGAVADLAGALAEHLLTPHEAAEAMLRLADELEDKEPVARAKAPMAGVARVVRSLRSRAALMPLVAQFAALKSERSVLDFADQVALAARIARDVPAVGEAERTSARVVLLDEYQDTSVAQLRMLRGLFGGGHPVTAVGDPHQGIYGWRGASAGSLLAFDTDFPRADGTPASRAHLTTSWRNDRAILQAANRVARALRLADEDAAPAVPDEAGESGTAGEAGAAGDEASTPPGPDLVPPLAARPDAGRGEVRSAFAAHRPEEAATIAAFLADRWRPGRGTAAVLCRKRDLFEPVRAALEAAGVPYQVVGLAGLLRTPEVTDVRAALQAAYDPSRGDALMRLLTGPAVALGPADLVALADAASARTVRRAGDDDAGRGGRREPAEAASIVEVLDQLPPPGWVSPSGRSLSDEGRARLVGLAAQLRRIRGVAHLPMPDLVTATEEILGLDVEVAVHEARAGAGGRARANLDELAAVAAEFDAGAALATLGAFLAWLDAAEEHERGLEAAHVEPDPAAVQVLTVHASKGLEWDVVVVAGLTEGDFPAVDGGANGVRSSAWLTGVAELPYPLRGDVDHLPELDVIGPVTHKDMDVAREEFRSAAGERELLEERRLAYVAMTRARHVLLLTGSWWGTRKTTLTPSRFLREVVADGSAVPLPPPWGGTLDAAPAEAAPAEPARAMWPAEPGGATAQALRDAASGVRSWLAAGSDRLDLEPGAEPSARAREWLWQARALLDEREAAAGEALPADPPGHLSASAVVQLARDPEAFARARRRPVPAEPNPNARRGTRFHAWVEQHFAAAALLDVDDLDDEATDADLDVLRRAFLASDWAARTPIAVEADVETPLRDGTLVRCRIDAVFPGRRSGQEVHVVDWKTGTPAADRSAREAREVQLALYRLAWSRLHGVPVERIAASFVFVGADDGVVTHDAPMLSELEIEDLVGRHLAELRA